MKRFILITLILLLVGLSAFAADYYPKYTGKPATITM